MPLKFPSLLINFLVTPKIWNDKSIRKRLWTKIFAYLGLTWLTTNFNFAEWHGKVFLSRLLWPNIMEHFFIELEHECIICVSGINSHFFFLFFAWIDDFCCLLLSSAAFYCKQNIRNLLTKMLFISETQIMRYNRSKALEGNKKKRSSITTMRRVFARFLLRCVQGTRTFDFFQTHFSSMIVTAKQEKLEKLKNCLTSTTQSTSILVTPQNVIKSNLSPWKI